MAVLVPLVVLFAADRLDLVAGAVFGALTSVHCRGEPYRRQALSVAVVAVAMVLSVAVGDLVAVTTGGQPWHEPVALAVTAAVGAVATAVTTAVKLGAPGGLIFTFATGACAHLALAPSDLGPHLAVTAVSAAFAWAVCAVGAAVSGLGPQRRAVARALDASADHLAAPDLTTRHRAAVAIETAWTNLALVGRRDRDSPAHLELVRAVDAAEELVARDDGVAEELRAAANAVRTGAAMPDLSNGTGSRPATVPDSRLRLIRDVLRVALRPGRHAGTWLLPYAARVGVAALLAGIVTHLLGVGHAYWAVVSAVSVLQATSTSRSVPRMVQRGSGTAVGVPLGLGLLLLGLPPWVVILLLAGLQWAAEMTIATNYAFGLLFATPVALLVSALGAPSAPTELAANRLWATLLGAAIAVSVAWLAPHRAWLTRLHRALARVRELGTPPVDPHRLRSALVELHEAHDVAAGEVPVGKLPTEELLDVSQHAYRLLDGRSPVRD